MKKLGDPAKTMMKMFPADILRLEILPQCRLQHLLRGAGGSIGEHHGDSETEQAKKQLLARLKGRRRSLRRGHSLNFLLKMALRDFFAPGSRSGISALSSHEPAFRHDACTVAITSLDQSIAFV
jgi:hypothetical protein